MLRRLSLEAITKHRSISRAITQCCSQVEHWASHTSAASPVQLQVISTPCANSRPSASSDRSSTRGRNSIINTLWLVPPGIIYITQSSTNPAYITSSSAIKATLHRKNRLMWAATGRVEEALAGRIGTAIRFRGASSTTRRTLRTRRQQYMTVGRPSASEDVITAEAMNNHCKAAISTDNNYIGASPDRRYKNTLETGL